MLISDWWAPHNFNFQSSKLKYSLWMLRMNASKYLTLHFSLSTWKRKMSLVLKYHYLAFKQLDSFSKITFCFQCMHSFFEMVFVQTGNRSHPIKISNFEILYKFVNVDILKLSFFVMFAHRSDIVAQSKTFYCLSIKLVPREPSKSIIYIISQFSGGTFISIDKLVLILIIYSTISIFQRHLFNIFSLILI